MARQVASLDPSVSLYQGCCLFDGNWAGRCTGFMINLSCLVGKAKGDEPRRKEEQEPKTQTGRFGFGVRQLTPALSWNF